MASLSRLQFTHYYGDFRKSPLSGNESNLENMVKRNPDFQGPKRFWRWYAAGGWVGEGGGRNLSSRF
jgi:hypothetical protein